MSAFIPRQQACPRIFHDLGNAAALLILKQATVTVTNDSSLVRAYELFMSSNYSHSRNIHALRPAAQWLQHRIVTLILPPINFPVHIQTISGL
jgi:hypothetical protein